MTSDSLTRQISEFMQFLARDSRDGERLPALSVLSRHLGISIASLREQLEVARAFGLVEVRPKTGIRRLPYRFAPAVLNSLSYATAVDSNYFFHAFSDLRNHIETAYWHEAVTSLIPEDHNYLADLVNRAFNKLSGAPIQIPHAEHRELHLTIYRRLNNPFVVGILEAYWEAYEAVGLNVYTDISYLLRVWNYHRMMVNAIMDGRVDEGFSALSDHIDLLHERFH